MRRIALASGLLTLALTACGASGRVVRTGPERPAKPLDCTIQVSLDGRVGGSYEVLGLVEAEGTSSVTELVPVLQQQACTLGADALIDLRTSVGSGYTATVQGTATGAQGVGTSYSTYHATATAVRLTSTSTRVNP